jgi:hypothetical protein
LAATTASSTPAEAAARNQGQRRAGAGSAPVSVASPSSAGCSTRVTTFTAFIEPVVFRATATFGVEMGCERGSENTPESPPFTPARRSASSTSSMDWKRASGVFSRQRRTTEATSAGNSSSGRGARSGGTGSRMCLTMTSMDSRPMKGGRPASIWYIITPSE